ncbi:MAG: Flp pilus assembly complex ATPase component TadA [Thermoplasmatales archaeon]|nr:MAG: Flp pilus assembly complex ATPase component TadA [Thermoplasmatales archaeon]
MSRKIAICPQCSTKILCEGEPGQKVVIECDNCGKKGLVSFAEKILIDVREKERKILKRAEKEEVLKRQKEEPRDKEREKQRLKIIEVREKEREAKKSEKEKKRELKEKQRLNKIELKKKLIEIKKSESETLRRTKKEKELKKREEELREKLRKRKLKEEKLKKLEAKKAVFKAEKAVMAAKKRKRESLRRAAKQEELKKREEELRKKKIEEEKLKKLETEKIAMEKKEKERETLKRNEEEELKRQEAELSERELKNKIEKLEEEIAVMDAKEKEREALLRRIEKGIEEEERKEKDQVEGELKEKVLKEREIEERLKQLKSEIAVMEAKEKEREALLRKTGIELEEGEEIERRKEDVVPGEKNFVEIDFYPVNEPFAYVKIIKDTTSLDKYYKVMEPQLLEEELNTLNLLQEKLINSVDTRLDEIESSCVDRFLVDLIDQMIEDNEKKSDDILKKKFLYYIKRDFLGYGKINSLMKDPNIEDISCDGSKVPIFLYHRRYGSLRSNIKFDNEKTLSAFVVKLAQKCGKHISIAEPMLDATMPDGSRIQMTLSEEVTTKGSTFTIRKFRSNPITPTNLIEYDTMSPEMIAYMWMAVENGHNALIAGSTAAGKTSTLNALSLFIPKEAKIVSIEETREINLPHPNWIPGVARSGFGEVVHDKLVGEIDLFDLMKAALRQRPEYILVGEIRGQEAYVLFQAMATGHTTYSTFHADSPKSVIHRLEGKPIDVPRVMLQSLDIVFIQVNAKVGDKNIRKCKQIVEIVDIDPNTKEILSNEVFRWDPAGDKFIYSGKSYILERIRNQHGMSKEGIMQEVRRRVEVLDWMCKNNINSFIEFAKVVSFYVEDPDELMKKIIDGSKIEKEVSNKIDVHKLEKSDKIQEGEMDLGKDLIKEEKFSSLSVKKKIRKSISFRRNKNNSK